MNENRNMDVKKISDVGNITGAFIRIGKGGANAERYRQIHGEGTPLIEFKEVEPGFVRHGNKAEAMCAVLIFYPVGKVRFKYGRLVGVCDDGQIQGLKEMAFGKAGWSDILPHR